MPEASIARDESSRRSHLPKPVFGLGFRRDRTPVIGSDRHRMIRD
jgi:hypothetical protein